MIQRLGLQLAFKILRASNHDWYFQREIVMIIKLNSRFPFSDLNLIVNTVNLVVNIKTLMKNIYCRIP